MQETRVRMNENGRIVIPAALREALGIVDRALSSRSVDVLVLGANS
jgi:DNA-binding transcriptional regulator/RsmH inhibitor MraZ